MKTKLGLLFLGLSYLVTADAATTYYAYCNHDSHDATGGWKGAETSSAQAARDDCAVHRRNYPSHTCNVQDIHS